MGADRCDSRVIRRSGQVASKGTRDSRTTDREILPGINGLIPPRRRTDRRSEGMVMKPPSFSGKGSVQTFLAKFDNCARYNRWMDREKLHYLTNALEDPAAQVLWDLQSDGAISYRELRATLVRVYESERQAEVYRAQLKLVRRKKGNN